MSIIKDKYKDLFDFFKCLNEFEKETNNGISQEPEYQNIIKKLDILQIFIKNVMNNINEEQTNKLYEKIQKDEEYFYKLFTEKNNNYYLDKKNILTQFDSSDESKSSSENSSTITDMSSLDDINSKNSEIDSDDDIDEDDEITTKLFAKSLIELNIRKNQRDFIAISEE